MCNAFSMTGHTWPCAINSTTALYKRASTLTFTSDQHIFRACARLREVVMAIISIKTKRIVTIKQNNQMYMST